MAQLIKPTSINVTSKNGEIDVSISIDLNINLNTDSITIKAQAVNEENIIKKNEKNIEIQETDVLIPDFFNSPIIDFGKEE